MRKGRIVVDAGTLKHVLQLDRDMEIIGMAAQLDPLTIELLVTSPKVGDIHDLVAAPVIPLHLEVTRIHIGEPERLTAGGDGGGGGAMLTSEQAYDLGREELKAVRAARRERSEIEELRAKADAIAGEHQLARELRGELLDRFDNLLSTLGPDYSSAHILDRFRGLIVTEKARDK